MQDMKRQADELRAALAGRGNNSGQFPRELKARVMRYAAARFSAGLSTRDVAAEIGLNRHTLAYWRGQGSASKRQSKERKAPLRKVRVVPDVAERPGIVLRVEDFEVEGLSVEDVGELLSLLR